MRNTVLTLPEQIEDEFIRIYKELEVANAPDKRKADIIDTIFSSEIHNKFFKPRKNDICYNQTKTRIKLYDVQLMAELTETFIKLNKRYGGVVKINQFANMSGITYATLSRWHLLNKSNNYIFTLNKEDCLKDLSDIIYICPNGESIKYKSNSPNIYSPNDEASYYRFDVIKRLKKDMYDSNTNGLSNDTMGNALRANNEEELGKMYEPRKMIRKAQLQGIASVQELPKLGEKLM